MIQFLYAVQTVAVVTFVLFMLLVYRPGKGSVREQFFRDTRARNSTLLFTVYYTILFVTLFVYMPAQPTLWLYVCGAVVAIAGLLIAFVARMQFRHHWRPITNPRQQETIMQTGMFSVMRHPIYVGRLLFFVGVLLMNNYYLLPVAVAYWWTLRKRLLSEEKAFAKKSAAYRTYMKHVKRLFFWR